MKLINKSVRPLGVIGARSSIIVPFRGELEITEKDLHKIKSNQTAARWIDSGLLVVEGETKIVGVLVAEENKTDTVEVSVGHTAPLDPEDKAIVKHVGKGRWNAFVNGEALSDKTIEKVEAEALAEEYNAPN